MNIPGFKIQRTLGTGGMATVYLAEQISLGREIALKIMAPDLIHADKSFCSRFIKEGRIIAKLRHENIITIHDIACIDGSTYFMSMEYCAGGTLKDRIKDGSAKAQALPIIRQIASALGYAHSQGFVHRDIKPANILFRDDGSAVLSDFGIVKTMDGRTQLTQAGFAIGTPEYMSPEQSAGKNLTGGADLYSLGVVLYEMLTGEKPFIGADPLSTALQHAQKPIPKLPSEFLYLQPLLDSLLTKNVNERCQDAKHLIAEIDRLEHSTHAALYIDATRMLQAASTSGEDALTTVTAPLESTKKRKVSGLALTLGIVVLFVVLLGAGGWIWKLNERNTITPTAQPTTGETAESHSEPDRVPMLNSEQRKKVERLLSIARAHIAMGRLREPPGSNAYEAYELVLEIEPDNEEASENRAEIERLISEME